MISKIVVILHDPFDFPFQLTWQVVELQVDHVLHRALITFDFSLRLWMIPGATSMLHTTILDIGLQVLGEVTRSVI